jgi:RimJ/RimL family protein N-acetyltransferase
LEGIISAHRPLSSTERPLADVTQTPQGLDTVKLRAARPEDAQLLFDWRNDPVTRAYSKTSTPISWEQHTAWYAQSLGNPNRLIFIAMTDGQPVGVIRGDREQAGWVLSWSIGSAYRGRGLLRLMILAVLPHFSGVVRAEIKADNIASMKAARSAGMTLRSRSCGLTHWVVDQ